MYMVYFSVEFLYCAFMEMNSSILLHPLLAWKHWLPYAPLSLFIFLLFKGRRSLVQVGLGDLKTLLQRTDQGALNNYLEHTEHIN